MFHATFSTIGGGSRSVRRNPPPFGSIAYNLIECVWKKETSLWLQHSQSNIFMYLCSRFMGRALTNIFNPPLSYNAFQSQEPVFVVVVGLCLSYFFLFKLSCFQLGLWNCFTYSFWKLSFRYRWPNSGLQMLTSTSLELRLLFVSLIIYHISSFFK